MADVNKTIDVQIKADMKEMLKELKRMPNMAGDEAKKMVNQLKRQFQRAEIAAKAQAKAHAKANQQMADSTKNSTNQMVRDMDRQIKKSKSARVQSRELGASLGSLEDVVSVVSPELGGLAMTVGTLGQGFRTLSRAMMTGNPIIMALIAVVASAATAYGVLNAATREAERRQKLAADATKKNNEMLAAQSGIIVELNKNMGATQRELLVQTGQMTQLEADIAAAKEESAAAANKDLLTQRQYIVEQKQLLRFAKTMRSNHHALSQEEKDRLESAMMLSGERRFQAGFAKNEAALYGQLGKFQDHLVKQIEKQKALANGIQAAHDKNLETRIEILQNENELSKAQEESDRQEQRRIESQARMVEQRAKEAKRIAEEKKRLQQEEIAMTKILTSLQASGNKAMEKAASLEERNIKTKASMMDNEIEKIDVLEKLESSLSSKRIEAFEAQKQQNLEQVQNLEQYYEAILANEEIDKIIAQEKEARHLQDMKFADERLKAIENEKKQRMELAKSIVSSSIEGANAVATIIKNVGGENKKAAMAAFRIQQAASLANIAMLTAEKIMAVAPNPFAIAGVTALGGLQAATVLSQSPPEKHMGGMITKGEDTQNVTVLTGEAVLDRMTVQRLGGEQGINRLQRGIGMEPQVVVMNPFKHFDRYANASLRRGGSMANIANRKASGGY